MSSEKRRRIVYTAAIVSSIALSLILFLPADNATTTSHEGYWYARLLDSDELAGMDIAALTYAPDRNRFYAVLQAAGPERGTTIVTLSTELEPLHTWHVSGARIEHPLATYDAVDGRIYLLDSVSGLLYSVAPEQFALRSERRLPAGVTPQAATFDESGALQVLDQSDRLLTFSLVHGDGETLEALAQRAVQAPQGDVTGHDLESSALYSIDNSRVQAVAASGRVANSQPVRQLWRYLEDDSEARSAVVGPSLDSTDADDVVSLFAVSQQGPIEISYHELPTILPEQEIVAPMVTAVNTWEWSPPSPDPAGITYLRGSGQLLISDSEVNEEDWYAGANLFLTDRDGNLQGTDDTTAFSREPTGVTVNPANGHIFISDDDDHHFYHLSGLPGSSSSTVLNFVNTEPAGSNDPEGIAYDTVSGHIFVVDGADSEVYRYNPGPDGQFGTGDDIVTSFDVGRYGVADPEGITHDAETDHLLVLDSDDGQVVEVTKSGQWLRDIELLAVNLDKPAGLVYGPTGSDPLTRTLYVVDRQQDNESDPNENDGLLFEFAVAAYFDGDVTATPTDTATPTPSDTPVTSVTDTPTPTSTSSPTETYTPSPTTTPTLASTSTSTATPTATSTSTATPTATSTSTATPTPSQSSTPTNTPVGPTGTPPPIPTDTPTVTPKPSATATPEGTAQPTPTNTPTAVPGERYRGYFPVLAFQVFNQYGEGNDTCPQAYPLLTDTTYQFLPEDRDDWYRFTIGESADVTIRLSNFTPLLGQVAAYRGRTCGSAQFVANNGNNSADKTLALGQQPAGNFYVYVSNDGQLNNVSLYSIIVETR